MALAAQGFTDPLPGGRPDRRHLRRVLRRTLLLQIDSVNVLERAHYLPAFSRLGPYDKALLDRAASGPRPADRELFEYWGHEASLLPVALHPLLRWRMDRARRLEEGWGGPLRVMRERPQVVARVLEQVRERGPVGAGALREGPRAPGTWWSWDEAKAALEYLFWSGQVTTHSRRGFERLYDLPERVLPPEVLDLPTPSRRDAQRELLRLSARAQGIATPRSLRDHFRLRPEADAGIADLVEEGALVPVTVEGRPWLLAAGADRPRRVARSALLSPFDPLVWERSRTEALFGFRYRLEIYVPAAQRVHGYYVLPFLHEEAMAARVDLKADRRADRLRVLASYGDPSCVPALAAELWRMARWQGLADVVVEPKGDLAAALTAACARPEG